MKIKRIAVTLLTAVMITGGAGSRALAETNVNMFQGDALHTGVYKTKAPDELRQAKWKVKTGGKVFSSAVVSKGVTFIGSEDGYLYAINKETGEIKWKYKTGGAVNSTAAVADGMVYFTSGDGNFYAVKETTGRLRWKFQTQGEKLSDVWDYYLSSPCVADGIVYFGSGDGNIYALDGKTGKRIWNYATGGIVHASPAIAEGVLYIGSYDGNMYALDVKKGTLKWKFKTVGDAWFPVGEIQSSATIADGTVYFGCRDYNVYALDAKTGTGKWNYKVPGTWVISTPVVANGMIYFGTSDGHMYYAMDAQTGDIKWKTPINLNVFSSAAAVGDSIYFGCFNGKLYRLDAKTGEIKATFQTEGSKENYDKYVNEKDEFKYNELLAGLNDDYYKLYDLILTMGSILSSPVVEDGVMYFGSTDGYIYAVK